MTTTLSTMPGSSEGKRNRKTKALNGLLSATALGLFLEGCGIGGDGIDSIGYSVTDGVATCTINNSPVPCDDPRIVAEFGPIVAANAEGRHSEGSEISSFALASAETLGQGVEEGAASGEHDNDLLESSSDADTLDGEGSESESHEDSDEDVELSEGEILDAIVVSAGDDTIEGTSDSDVLAGGAGADTYVFGEDGGEDTIVEVAEDGIVNTLKFEGDYQVSDFSFERGSHDGRDLIVIADTDDDGEAENEITLDNYFTSETGSETAYSIVLQINDGEAFAPSLEA